MLSLRTEQLRDIGQSPPDSLAFTWAPTWGRDHRLAVAEAPADQISDHGTVSLAPGDHCEPRLPVPEDGEGRSGAAGAPHHRVRRLRLGSRQEVLRVALELVPFEQGQPGEVLG